MGTLFGELVEPSTRAIIHDDYDECLEYLESPIEWEGNQSVPKKIDFLIFVETENITKFLNACVFKSPKLICKIRNGIVEVHELENKYFVILKERKALTLGQIVEQFKQWIEAAQIIYAIKSEEIALFQTFDSALKPPSLVREISNDNQRKFKYQKLEPPNLITGLGASVLTYCIHIGLKCSLFIIYMDNAPLDSVNMGPIIELFGKMDIAVENKLTSILPNASNLYL